MAKLRFQPKNDFIYKKLCVLRVFRGEKSQSGPKSDKNELIDE